ncbi:bifunctional phosphoribosylaminoimidazolecarboxamide formyltransferase/IMP cyclohydrolase [Candidatus Thorarchaeota archaeon]|nr:MAG: bifunctional phosphoribosylaminoimidazolecarboxamide formyltransferase/IMP cyclohydrolase [Candidatus Thorarchaeota archaeon]
MERRLAIISVFDKEGIGEFCKNVSSYFDFISTGKTASILEESGVSVTRVSDFTGYPEILGGRVKTLHPKVLGGILGTTEQKSELETMNLQPIGLVVSNLYPFDQVISKQHNLMDAIENIDIGGVTLLRAAAKNYHEVLIVSSPSDYERVANSILEGNISDELRKELAIKAFYHTAKYDIAISRYLSSEVKWPSSFVMGFDNPQDLRYGENWHQEAKYYLNPNSEPFYKQIHGKAVSYNNLVDFTSAIGVLSELNAPTCAIIKHTSPCGVASSDDIETAFDHAFATDNLSAFGSVMGFNRVITEPLAKKLNAMFVDAIIAPEFDETSMEILMKKENLILCTFSDYTIPDLSIRLVPNGILVQPSNTHIISEADLKVVSDKRPSVQDMKDLMFAWKVVKYAKSNAAVISTGTRTLGVGMGQTSRIGAVELALKRAGERAEGSVLASDAFFPYRDSIDAAAEKGISAIISPGGSIRDKQSITAANDAGIILVWSNIRAFLH